MQSVVKQLCYRRFGAWLLDFGCEMNCPAISDAIYAKTWFSLMNKVHIHISVVWGNTVLHTNLLGSIVKLRPLDVETTMTTDDIMLLPSCHVTTEGFVLNCFFFITEHNSWRNLLILDIAFVPPPPSHCSFIQIFSFPLWLFCTCLAMCRQAAIIPQFVQKRKVLTSVTTAAMTATGEIKIGLVTDSWLSMHCYDWQRKGKI